MATSGKCTKKMKHFCKITPSPPYCLAFIDELEKQLFIKKTVEVGQ